MENNLTDDFIHSSARLAVYDNLHSAPRIVDIEPLPTREYIEELASQTYNLSHQVGGSIPYTVIREVAENFIHAHFCEPVISILNNGSTITFADQGPGITQKQKAQLPGFTSATSQMKEYIRGVGSGLPIVKDYMNLTGGYLIIDDNINTGTVVTISSQPNINVNANAGHVPQPNIQSFEQPAPISYQHQQIQETPYSYGYTPQQTMTPLSSLSQQRISAREDAILKLALEHGSIGQTDIKNLLGISLATSTRALETLEKSGYLTMTANKKRILTDEGYQYLRDHIN